MKILYIALVVVVLSAVVYFFVLSPTGQLTAKDEFAQCLTEKGATMYGAYWCGHCQNQKSMFGPSFAHIDYVECTQDQNACSVAGV